MSTKNATMSSKSWKSSQEKSKHIPRILKGERNSLQRDTKSNTAVFCKYES